MKRVLALGTMFILVLGFQNCGRQGLSSGSGAEGGVYVSSSEATPAAVTYVEIPNVANSANGQFKLSDEASDSRLVISLQSGKIQLMDGSNQILDEKCLPASEMSELKTILAGSKICEAPQPSEDMMCAMVMKSAYASLYANESRVKLGEEYDSCGRGRKDLCGDLSSVFQSFVSHVKANWSSMNCE